MQIFIKQKIEAFTLSELLVVLVIVGILILLAMPVLMPLISRTKAIEAKQQLQYVYTLQKSYFYEYSRYSSNLDQIGFEQAKLIEENGDGKANYKIEILSAEGNTFRARATAVTDFDGDGQINIWEIDQDQNLTETAKD